MVASLSKEWRLVMRCHWDGWSEMDRVIAQRKEFFERVTGADY
jgi:hypothetical protein